MLQSTGDRGPSRPNEAWLQDRGGSGRGSLLLLRSGTTGVVGDLGSVGQLTVDANGVDHGLDVLVGRLHVVLRQDALDVHLGQGAVCGVALEVADEPAVLAGLQVVQRLQTNQNTCYSGGSRGLSSTNGRITLKRGFGVRGPGVWGPVPPVLQDLLVGVPLGFVKEVTMAHPSNFKRCQSTWLQQRSHCASTRISISTWSPSRFLLHSTFLGSFCLQLFRLFFLSLSFVSVSSHRGDPETRFGGM